jgi:hypothetical protein
MTDLNDVLPAGTGWVLIDAADLNEAGEVVGTGILKGRHRAFLLRV